MTRYHCDSFRPVEAEDVHAAAEIFAARQARREYGKRGYCRTLRLDCWTENGCNYTYEAFIGYSVRGGTTSGHNVWLYISREAAASKQEWLNGQWPEADHER